MAHQPSNLTMHRDPQNVWDRLDYEQSCELSRRRAMGACGFLMIAAGTYLVGRACRLAVPKRPGSDLVGKASEHSFPASDPPAWNGAIGMPAQG